MLKFNGFILLSNCLLIFGQVPKEIGGGAKGNPGAKFRITQQGLDRIAQGLDDVLADEIPKIRLSELSKESKDFGLTLSDLHVTKFKRPDSLSLKLAPPDGAVYKMANADVTMQGDMEGAARGLTAMIQSTRTTGPVTSTASNVNVEIQMKIKKGSDGDETMRIEKCTATVGSVKLDLSKVQGPGVSFINGQQGNIEAQAKTSMESQICDTARSIMESVLDSILDTQGLQVPLPMNPKAAKIMQMSSFDPTNYQIDNRLINDPEIDESYLQTSHRAEVSYAGNGGTPFGPKDLPMGSNGMFQLVISDYLINSFLYQSYKRKDLDLNIKQPRAVRIMHNKMPFVVAKKGRMETQIDASIVEGKGPGPGGKNKKGKSGKMAPNPGKAQGPVSGTVKAKAQTRLSIKDGKLVGSSKIQKLDIKMAKGEGNGNDLSQAIRSALEEQLNDVIGTGIGVPVLGGIVDLNGKTLTVADRRLELSGDVQVNKKALATMVRNAIEEL